MQVITANRLIDGEVVWLASGDRWVESVEAADVFAEKQAASSALDRAQAAVDARIIVDPYEIAVNQQNGTPVPVRFREQIRALGPTVRLDLGKQARVQQSSAA